MNMTGSFRDQEIAVAWRHRRETSINLAIKMKLFKSSQFQMSVGDNNFYSSRYTATHFGITFRKSPAPIQAALISIFLGVNRASKIATRFKWITGFASFAALAVKVWHSGLISSWWIALSAVIGLAIGVLTSLWR
ncbi:hypothetical protein [Burkholderia ubonensis]|uniref:hypothetical protein n=1 Tax=Burkholderia ubonensis TaxID=101571 RepID=UPI0012FA20D6|nr:hypothetical protein [Burkholderia ubonensis]